MAPRYERCEANGKVCYSRTDARAKAKAVRRRDREPVSEYHCPVCGWWHYGTTPRPVRRRGHR